MDREELNQLVERARASLSEADYRKVKGMAEAVRPAGLGRGTRTLFRYQIRTRDVVIQSCEECSIRLRQIAQMTVSDLFGRLDPPWKVRYVMPIRDERKWRGGRLFEAQQKGTCLGNGKPIGWSLGQYPQKSKLRNRAAR